MKAKTTKLDKAEKYKIQLLEQPSTRHLYKTRKDKHIKGRMGDINQDWASLKTLITKTAKEVLRLQSKRKPRRLKIWNEMLEEAVKSKKETYLTWLSGKKYEDYIEYKRKRAMFRKLSRESNRESWEQFVKRFEYDATGAQRFIFKVFRNLRNEITDKAKTDVIPEEE
jgi:hypothetical protein